MLMFNDADTHAILAFVATGHVLFMHAASRTPLRCIDVGVQAHAAFPSPDETYVVVANQNGKLLQLIATNNAKGSFALDTSATVDLASCITPNGAACQDPALRPDTAPICPVIDHTSRFTFVTLRGGGMLVVDSTATPMAIVAEYDRASVHPNGCGGLQTAGKMYINSGGGTPANPLEADLYSFTTASFSSAPNPPNTPAPSLVFSHDARGAVDSHGATLTAGERNLWVADRAANRIVVVDTRNDTVVNEIALAGRLSADPAPDLMDVSPNGKRVYLSLRGPIPLTGNGPGVDNAVGGTPGVAMLRVTQGGRSGRLQAIAPISHLVDATETADPHALRVRKADAPNPARDTDETDSVGSGWIAPDWAAASTTMPAASKYCAVG
jgi:DNA-binding beta-propeller fold protein YncE